MSNTVKRTLYLMIAALFVISLVSCKKSDSKSANYVISEGGGETTDPENTELTNETGKKISSENLKKKKGKANGIDVSKWQGEIDWKAVKKSNIDFAMIRIGFRGENGKLYKDDAADYNLQNAEAAGLKTGVYFFSTATNETEAIEEAEFTKKLISGYAISYPVAYDCEGYLSAESRMYGITAEERTKNANAYMKSVSESGYTAMLYASKNDLEGVGFVVSEIGEKYKIWLAQYTDPAYPQVENPKYSGRYDMWQYTNRGTVNGVSGNVDMVVSYFVANQAKPKNAADRPSQAKAPTKPSDNIYEAVNEAVTAKEIVNLRSDATTKSDIIGQLKNGETLTRIGKGSNGWSKLIFNGQTVYAVTSYLTTDITYTSEPQAEQDIVNGKVFTAANDRVTAKVSTNLRTAPTTDGSQIVYELKKGEFLNRTAISESGWSRLDYNGQTVYAVTSYLTADASYVSKDPNEGRVDGQVFEDVNEQVTAKDSTNLRTAPTTGNSQIVYELKKGEYVTRTGISDNGWSRINYNGQTVYAVSSYLTN